MAADKESRFKHLLQPIRDLSKNFELDIAGELEEYLEELESITISFEDGESSLNFAEAAMVIQVRRLSGRAAVPFVRFLRRDATAMVTQS